MTVAVLLQSLDTAELAEWQAHFKIKAEEDERARMAARAQSSQGAAQQRIRKKR